MRKAIFLLPVLFAYALILGHNLVPHVHSSPHETTVHDHHAGNDHPVQHKHEPAQKDNDEEKSSLPDFFSLFVHSPFSVTIDHILVPSDEGKEIQNARPDVVIEEEFSLRLVQLADQGLPPDCAQIFYSGRSLLYFSLRAPPAC